MAKWPNGKGSRANAEERRVAEEAGKGEPAIQSASCDGGCERGVFMGNLDRNWVAVLGDRDWPAALRTARELAEPGARVAALAGLTGNAPEDRVDEVLQRAVDAAVCGGGDEFERCRGLVAVIGAAIGRGRTERARGLLGEVHARSAKIEPVSSRAAAIEQLLRHAVAMGEEETRAVASAMLDVSEVLARDPVAKWRKRGR